MLAFRESYKGIEIIPTVMSDELRLRDPLPEPRTLSFGLISVYHPGYPDDDAPLIALRGYDSDKGHLWHEVARTACAIICNNRFDGWLSQSKDSQAARFEGELLPSGVYWWHVPDGRSFVVSTLSLGADLTDSPDPYAIITEFRSWRFPSSMPETWSSTEPATSQEQGNKCQVTCESHATNEAHIVPVLETEWYNVNKLTGLFSTSFGSLRGTRNDANIDNTSNLIHLRSDIHHAWDQKELTFVPKMTKTSKSGVVIHCLGHGDVAYVYHNLPLRGYIRTELLLARFAWTLFPLAMFNFLTMDRARMLWVSDAQGKMTIQQKSATECHAIANSPTPRSTSPKKRKQMESEAKTTDVEDKDTRRSSWQSTDSGFSSVSDSVDFTRGRKRYKAGYGW